MGVPSADPPRGQPVGDESGAPETGAHAKKKTLTAVEQAEPRIQALRRKFIEVAKSLDSRRLVFIDEAASHIAMTREYARAPRGERAHGIVPRNAGTVTTMIGALDLNGVRAMMTIEGATDAEVFETFLERMFLRKLKPGDIVVLDNVGAHKTAEVRRLIRTAGARVLYLPPKPEKRPSFCLGTARFQGRAPNGCAARDQKLDGTKPPCGASGRRWRRWGRAGGRWNGWRAPGPTVSIDSVKQ